MNTPIMTSKNKGIWHRLKRVSEGRAGSIGIETSIVGKRNISDIDTWMLGPTRS